VSGYSKLHSSIATSSIMAMPVSARWLWAFMLSQADAHGVVEGAVPGLAIAANVTVDECQAAIEAFLKPDQHSRTKDLEGRRLVEVDGGWQIVSYAKWRHKMSAAERRDYKRQHESARRERLRAASKQSTAVAVERLQGRARGPVVDK
jgi:hypothetical protein